MWLDIGVGLLVTIIFFLATFVLVRSKGPVNSTFAVFSYLVAIWIIANYIGANFKLHPVSRYFVHGDFLFGTVVALAFWYFTATLLQQANPPGRLKDMRHILRLPLSILTAVAIITSLSPWAVRIATPAHQPIDIQYGAGFTLYTVILGGLLLWGIINTGLTLRFAKEAFHRQVVTISKGLIAGVVLVALANLILPELTQAANINLVAGNASYLGIVAFIVATFYAIARHRLFDLRFFVVRATAYAFSVVLVTVFYLAPAIWIISHAFHVRLSGGELALLVLLSLALLILYGYLRRLFDLVTSKTFFRNFYDSQDVLDRLGEFLVRTLDVADMQAGSRRILLAAIRASSLDFWFSTSADQKTFHDFKRLFPHASDVNVVVLDEGRTEQALAHQLYAQDIAVVVRLRTTHGDLGYLTLGFKDSGQAYTTQDKRLLSTAADEIAISMQNSLRFEEIQHFNETLQANVSDATRKLRRTNDKLQALDSTKDEFITMASHQLRTPLTSVKGYLSMVLEGDAGKLNKQQQELLTQSYVSAQRMVYLIADLLNLSRLSTGKFVIEPGPVDLDEVVQAEIDQLRETAKSRGITLTYDRPEGLSKLMLDETKIHQVVMNFIDNAIYYTPSGGKIDVRLRETPTYVEYTVKDNGIGVPKAEQHKLFAKFYRAGNARKARPDGTGLGLFMAKKVVVAQGGAIIFESEEGKGSTFGFRFSKAHHLAPVEPIPVATTATL